MFCNREVCAGVERTGAFFFRLSLPPSFLLEEGTDPAFPLLISPSCLSAPASPAHSFNKGSCSQPPGFACGEPIGAACLGSPRRGWGGIGAQPAVFAKHSVLASAGGAGALGKHKELRSWTHAGRWGDEASGFVRLVKEGWRGGSLSFNPSARGCVRNRGFFASKVLKSKAELWYRGIILTGGNVRWSLIQPPSKQGLLPGEWGAVKGHRRWVAPLGALERTWELDGGGSTSRTRLQRQ